jgi:hypothetical protein
MVAVAPVPEPFINGTSVYNPSVYPDPLEVIEPCSASIVNPIEAPVPDPPSKFMLLKVPGV